MYVLVKYHRKGIYTRKVIKFKKKGIKFYFYILFMKILGKEIDILEE